MNLKKKKSNSDIHLVFFLLLVHVKDFNLHSFINSDNFTNGEFFSDKKNPNCTFGRVSQAKHAYSIWIKNKYHLLPNNSQKSRLSLTYSQRHLDARLTKILF